MTTPLLSFFGDDFTGSTDAMESLAREGLRTLLFTHPPTPQQLARHPDLDAFGVAGTTRALATDLIERQIRPAFAALRERGAPIVHYKVCSTFDSSPKIGSIGRVIDVGMDELGTSLVPLLVAAPSLGRYCVFGNLFARCGAESEPHRLDRHPSMSRHPTTPMDEADLRRHLAKQAGKRIELFDILQLAKPIGEAVASIDALAHRSAEIILMDLLYEDQLAKVGALLAHLGQQHKPLFVVGSSGVESALCAHWRDQRVIGRPHQFRTPNPHAPIIAVSGSCSPATTAQIRWAVEHGFVEVALDARRLDEEDDVIAEALHQAVSALKSKRSVVIHTGCEPSAYRVVDPDALSAIGPALGRIVRHVLEARHVRRVLVAGGDTSGQVALALGIECLEMIAELTRGVPLCKAIAAPSSPANGIEIAFKGGQIGPVDFFGTVEAGSNHHG